MPFVFFFLFINDGFTKYYDGDGKRNKKYKWNHDMMMIIDMYNMLFLFIFFCIRVAWCGGWGRLKDWEHKSKYSSGTGCCRCRPLFIFWTKAIFVLEIGRRMWMWSGGLVFLPFEIIAWLFWIDFFVILPCLLSASVCMSWSCDVVGPLVGDDDDLCFLDAYHGHGHLCSLLFFHWSGLHGLDCVKKA